jgi:hypothetical protein
VIDLYLLLVCAAIVLAVSVALGCVFGWVADE